MRPGSGQNQAAGDEAGGGEGTRVPGKRGAGIQIMGFIRPQGETEAMEASPWRLQRRWKKGRRCSGEKAALRVAKAGARGSAEGRGGGGAGASGPAHWRQGVGAGERHRAGPPGTPIQPPRGKAERLHD